MARTPEGRLPAEERLDERGLHFLAASFAAGALYDVAVAIALLLAPVRLLALFGLPAPPEPMHFRFAALLLLVLPLFYQLPARHPARYAAVAAASVGARLAGAVFLAAHVIAGAPVAYAAFATIDLVFGAVHAVGLWWAGFDLLGRARR